MTTKVGNALIDAISKMREACDFAERSNMRAGITANVRSASVLRNLARGFAAASSCVEAALGEIGGEGVIDEPDEPVETGVCEACETSYIVQVGMEPTPLCNSCAHKAVEILRELVVIDNDEGGLYAQGGATSELVVALSKARRLVACNWS